MNNPSNGIGAMLDGLRWDAAWETLPACSAAEFAETASHRAAGLPHVILLSGSEHDCSRRSIAFLRPTAILRVKGDIATLITARETLRETGDPFSFLQAASDGLRASWDTHATHARAHASPEDSGPVPDFPQAMIGGYVAYEAAHAIERLPSSTMDELALPDLFFLWPSELLLHDGDSGAVTRVLLTWRFGGKLLPVLDASASPHDARGNNAAVSATPVESSGEHDSHAPVMTRDNGNDAISASLRRSFSRQEYEDAVQRIRAHIHEGDVYQVNLSQRFVFPLAESPFSFWLRLFAENPAPFYAWVDAGDHQIVSTSMERLFAVGRMCTESTEAGTDSTEADEMRRYWIETRPIKGTRPRGKTLAEDRHIEEELRASDKDDAELSMIVDLARNDIGRVCRAGSVRVAEHKRIERYENVMHLVSVVTGTLAEGISVADVFRALFPGGSITGCPKIRAMEIIDELEPVTRHVYTGSIGFLSADGSADFNIAIRTAVFKDGSCHLSVGGGIVYDSDPAAEYAETLDKGRTFFRLADIDTNHLEE
ncbi:MAG: anthranilate synthase component I family protein [Bacteroidetes bacterium]|nr:anthranilate synthase component I family protein [Bacteroidota bacterium]